MKSKEISTKTNSLTKSQQNQEEKIIDSMTEIRLPSEYVDTSYEKNSLL